MRTFMLAACLVSGPALTAQSADTSLFTPRDEVRLAFTHFGLVRAVAEVGQRATRANGPIRSIEAFGMLSDGGGASVQYASGSLPGTQGGSAAGEYLSIDGRILFGSHTFAVVPGYVWRQTAWSDSSRAFGFAQLGAVLGRSFPGAAVQLSAGGMYRRTPRAAKADSLVVSGYEARTSLVYALPRVPVFLSIGYMREVLRYARKDLITRHEENSAILISLGLQSGMPAR